MIYRFQDFQNDFVVIATLFYLSSKLKSTLFSARREINISLSKYVDYPGNNPEEISLR